MKPFLALILFLTVLHPAAADAQVVFSYSRTILKIVPRAVEPTADDTRTVGKPTGKDKDVVSELLPPVTRAPKEFKVEVREPTFLETKDFIVHRAFADNEGLLILYNPPQIKTLQATRMIASADVLFADADGNIIKIAPRLDIANLSEPIESGRPIHALVFLKSGIVAATDIRIGDRLENNAFKTHPVIIQ